MRLFWTSHASSYQLWPDTALTNLTTWVSMVTVTTQINVAEAKAKLSDLIERAVDGEDIVIARAGSPRVRLTPAVARRAPRLPGRWKDAGVLVDGWDAELTDQFDDL